MSNFQFFRVEITRAKDASEEAELPTTRQTNRDGLLTLDPSKPLPHEYEEGHLNRYNDNSRTKYGTSKRSSGVFSPNDSFALDKSSIRDILLRVLSNEPMESVIPLVVDQHISDKVNGVDEPAPTKDGDDVVYPNQTIDKLIDANVDKASLESPEANKLPIEGEYCRD